MRCLNQIAQLALGLLTIPVLAQPGPAVTVTFSHQPLETFKAAFLTKLPSVQLVKAVACSDDFTTTGLLAQGRIIQAADSIAHIGTVDMGLVTITVNRAKHKSKKYITAEVLLWASLIGGSVIPGGMVYTVFGYKIAPAAILGLLSKKASDTWATDQGTDPATLKWINPDGPDLKLTPRACVSGLFLGTWDYKQPFISTTAVVTAVALH